ncbi:MAG: hypothetical protein AB1782_16270 [Cyanobacteriota bacterium]
MSKKVFHLGIVSLTAALLLFNIQLINAQSCVDDCTSEYNDCLDSCANLSEDDDSINCTNRCEDNLSTCTTDCEDPGSFEEPFPEPLEEE